MSHTPGPWRVDPDLSSIGLGGVMTADNCVEFCISTGYEPSYMRIEDAHLIAAAPELLDALTKLANEAFGFLSQAQVEQHGRTNMQVLQQRIDEARAAIAKASE